MRFKSLDGFRVVASYSIVVYHALEAFGIRLSYFKAIAGFFFLTFFIGSGFLVGKILFRHLRDRRSINVRRFYLRRVLRTWPLYFIGLAVYSVSAIPVEGFWRYFGFVQNFWQQSFYQHSWSIAIEEQFYFFAPVLTWLMARHIRPSLAFLGVLAVVIYARQRLGFNLCAVETNHTLRWIDGLLLGVFLASEEGYRVLELIKRHYRLIQFAAPVVFAYAFFNCRSFGSFRMAICSTMVAGFFVSTLNEKSLLGRWLSIDLFQKLTHRTYALYVFHLVPISFLAKTSTSERGLSLVNIGWLILAVLASTLLAEMFWRLVDRPVLAFRESRFPDK